MDMMQTYMSRFDKLNELSDKEYAKTEFHAESFFSNTLAQAGIPISRMMLPMMSYPRNDADASSASWQLCFVEYLVVNILCWANPRLVRQQTVLFCT